MKYQEALNWTITYVECSGEIEYGSVIDRAIKTLQQAIDKANKYDEKETAAKVKCVDIGMDYRTIYKYICLNCGNSSDEITKYCSNCGKELELEDE